MVLGEDFCSFPTPSVCNLAPEQGHPAARRVEVRFLEEPVFIEERPEGSRERRSGGHESPYLIRLGSRPRTVLRSLHRQAEL